jgi:predicted ABC-type ATPase
MININRVRLRVAQGGHDVPEDKIVSRYSRSLDLLLPAIRETDRAYVFDNSGENKERVWVAEITAGEQLELKTDRVPAWFQRAVLDKISARL